MIYSLFISCPKGLEYLLEDELKTLGLRVTRVSPQGVYGEANLEIAYKLCLWSRLANRVQVILFSGEASDQKMLYALCQQFQWGTVFTPEKTLTVEFHGSSAEIRNTLFGAQVIKDAIVDQYRARGEERPMIDRTHAQIRIHAYLKHDILTVSFDLTGYSLHRRGYRLEAVTAPLKENVAAAMLIRAKWPELASKGYLLHDPFCGSGTLVIEATLMAANFAPGLLRNDQSLHCWEQHQPELWQILRQQAEEQIIPLTHRLCGTDSDPQAITIAEANAMRAGISDWVSFTSLPLNALNNAVVTPNTQGLVVANPPYGERLGEERELTTLYKQIGSVLNTHFQGWRATILTSNLMLAKSIGLRAEKQYTLYNGALECKLYCFDISTSNQLRHDDQRPLSENAQMLANRLQKNARHLNKWAKRHAISCYRIYDADLPEYAYAIDLYNDYAVLQEYVAPKSIDPQVAGKRSLEVMQVVPRALNIAPDRLIIKQRKQQKGSEQYQKVNQLQHVMQVTEGQAHFNVNLHDYLDTGLFLDHRLLRLEFAKLPRYTRFLNCFCYTGTASVHAALAGALTTNVDLSNTYLNWAEDNFKLNQIDTSKHQFIQYDCLEWLKTTRERFDVIFLDPPSFSNSKRMTETLDIQRDHEALIQTTMRLLNTDGILYFSTNFRQFKLSTNLTAQFNVNDISASTIDLDFKRNQRIHQCFKITVKRDL